MVSILNKLALQFYSIRPLELDHKRQVDFNILSHTILDKSWLYEQIKTKCCSNETYNSDEYKALINIIQQYNQNQVLDIINNKGFNIVILKYITEDLSAEFKDIIISYLKKRIQSCDDTTLAVVTHIFKNVSKLIDTTFIDFSIKFCSSCLKLDENALTCFSEILKNDTIRAYLDKKANTSYIYEYIDCLYNILSNVIKDCTNYSLLNSLNGLDKTKMQVLSMVKFVEDFNASSQSELAKFDDLITPDLNKSSVFIQCLIALCRFDAVNKYALTPYAIFERDDVYIDDQNYFAFLQDFLLDADILQGFVFRLVFIHQSVSS